MSRTGIDTTPLGEATPAGMISSDINGIRYLALDDETLYEALPPEEIQRRTFSAPPLIPNKYYCDKLARVWLPEYMFPWSQQSLRHKNAKSYIFPWPDGYSRHTLKSPGELRPFKGPYADHDAGIMQRNIDLVTRMFGRDLTLMLGDRISDLDDESIKYELILPPFQTRQPAPGWLRAILSIAGYKIAKMGAREKAVAFRAQVYQ